ncbi:HAD-like domain-containing protein [Dioszegia hungarica]|uniref:HAD-like domain-containing protein n=1 Tax=Dioszegia hungarica TaxID=4972 RepID=A0AA38LWC1_9TREE|nr:HAD-like domain-containing protein [Dioszegia hungarica]KAI9638220.1 HAD-like domain-containing protein [Dioszegia hungarica]
MSSNEVTAKAMLFDMDGTLLDSTPAVLAVWTHFASEYNLDLSEVLRTSHGVRTVDNMKRWCGISDEAELQAATELFETMIVTEAKRLQDAGERGLEILPGVQDFLETLRGLTYPAWAIVTSATGKYASAALPTAGIVAPPHLITADDVTRGKPFPEPYLKGAELVNVDIKDCIVVEDAPSGIRSGVASGARVLAVCTSHARKEIENLGATWIVEDLSRVTASGADGHFTLVIDTSSS